MPERDARFTIRPPPARRIGPKAARQQRKVPVRLIRSVSSQACGVVASMAALCRTAAAQTNAVGVPTRAAMAKRRSTSPLSPTSTVAIVAAPPFLWIVSLTASSCDSVRAARTTWAPARAIASAVARPMPRPAPVTIATLPCSHPVASGRAVHLAVHLHPRSQRPVKAFVGHNARLETQVGDGMLPTLHAPDAADRLECPCRTGDVVRWSEEASLAVDDDFRQRTAAVGNHRGAGGLRFGCHHAKRLLPLRRTEDRACIGHPSPQLGSDQPALDGNAGLSPMREDMGLRVVGVVGLAVEVDPDARLARDGNGIFGAFFRTESAGKDDTVSARD